jgi:hypothetical protein
MLVQVGVIQVPHTVNFDCGTKRMAMTSGDESLDPLTTLEPWSDAMPVLSEPLTKMRKFLSMACTKPFWMAK